MRIREYLRSEVRESRTWVLVCDFGLTWWEELDTSSYAVRS